MAASLSNEFAPEHLQLEVAEPWDVLEHIRHAGAIFLGHSTPEAIGDYLAGPNHTLPTSGAARYASPLCTETFMKHSSLIQYSPKALEDVSDAIAVLTGKRRVYPPTASQLPCEPKILIQMTFRGHRFFVFLIIFHGLPEKLPEAKNHQVLANI